jgi:WD40 repeat protein
METGRRGASLKGHKGQVQWVAFRPDGLRLASASAGDLTVRVWDWAAGPFPGLVEGGESSLGGGLAFSPDGRRLVWGIRATGGGRVLGAATGKELLRFGAAGEWFHHAAYHPDGKTFVAVGDRSGMRVYDAATGKSLRALVGARSHVRALAFSPDGKRLATTVGPDQNDVRIWDTASWKIVLTVPKSNVVAFSPDGKQLVVNGEDGVARVHDAETGREVRRLLDAAAPIDHLAYSPDGKRVVTWDEPPGEDRNRPGVLRLWDAEAGRLLLALKGHTRPVTAAAFAPGGRLLSGSDDETVRVWDVETGQELVVLRGHGAGITAIQPGPDGRGLAAEVGGDRLVLRLAPSPTETVSLAHRGQVGAVAFSPDGTRLLTIPLNAGLPGSLADPIKVWDARTGEALPLREDATSAAWAPDGKHLALGQGDGTIVLWDPAAGKAVLTLKGPGGTVMGLAFSPDGSRLASYALPIDQRRPVDRAGGAEESPAEIRVWDARTGKEERALQGPKGGLLHLTYNRDGSRLLALAPGEELKLWEAATGRAVPVPKPAGPVVGAAFSPAEDLLALAGEGGVSLWDAAGKEVRRLKIDPVSMAVAFSRDGRLLVTDAGGEGVKLWEVATGRQAATFPTASGSVLSLALSPNGRWLVAGRADHTVVRWELPTTGRH